MNQRQRKFTEFYIQCGNASEAAKKSGYSEKYAAQNADKLLKNTNIQTYLKELQEQIQDENILTAKERQLMLSEIAKDKNHVEPSDRIRAIDTLNKMTGEYINKLEVNGKLKTETSKLDALVKQMSNNV